MENKKAETMRQATAFKGSEGAEVMMGEKSLNRCSR